MQTQTQACLWACGHGDVSTPSFEGQMCAWKYVKVRFTQKVFDEMVKCHSCEPFFAPELGGKFKLMNGTALIKC